MASVPAVAAGSGTTAVLGVKIVQELATTGAGLAGIAWTTASGVASILTGSVLLGRGRDLSAGTSLDDA